MKKIDAHAHIGCISSWCSGGFTSDKFVEQMNQYKFEKAIISTMSNEKTKKAVDKYPNRFVGIAWINPHDGKESIKEIYNCVNKWGFKGIKLHPLLQAYVANEKIVHPIAQVAEELDIPLFIHSGHPPYSLPWSIAQLAEDFPKVKIIMLHMGHGHGVYIQAAIDMAKKFPNIYLETSGMPMHTKIKEAYEEVGFDRVMFGTDVPSHDPSVEIQRTLVSGLNEKQLEDVFYNNIKKLLNL
jgi:uncharacterized protein